MHKCSRSQRALTGKSKRKNTGSNINNHVTIFIFNPCAVKALAAKIDLNRLVGTKIDNASSTSSVNQLNLKAPLRCITG